MDYGTVIDRFKKWLQSGFVDPVNPRNFLNLMVQLFQLLKQNGLTNEKLTPDLANQVLEIFEDDNLIKLYRIKHRVYLIHYIKYLSNTILAPGPPSLPPLLPEKKEIIIPEIEDGCETPDDQLIKLKPEDFKDIEYDEEFIETIKPKKDKL